jgi:purine-binding chemotaxis protein CheW
MIEGMRDESIVKGGGLSPTRAVRVMFAGSQCIGLFADEIESIADWRTPTPLPGAPPVVLGVVYIRGRMLTVLDAAVLLGKAGAAAPTRIVTLRGDEQIGLAVERTGDLIEGAAVEMKDPDEMNSLIGGVIKEDHQLVLVFDSRQLFATAMRGRERRRRNF